jgi:hypothetical protein
MEPKVSLLTNPTFHCPRLFHSPILRPLSLIAVYIPSFQVLRGRPRFFLPSGFQFIIIFGNAMGPYFQHVHTKWVVFGLSSNIVSCASIFPLIHSFVFIKLSHTSLITILSAILIQWRMYCALNISAIKRLRKTQNVFGTGNNCAEFNFIPGNLKKTLLPVSISFQSSKGKHAHRWTPSFA